MNYGKNQRALLTFLQKNPNRWHRMTRAKAIVSAVNLQKHIGSCVGYSFKNNEFYVSYFLPLPQMLIEQNG